MYHDGLARSKWETLNRVLNKVGAWVGIITRKMEIFGIILAV